MLFTVITPNYNGGQYLETALQSIIAQKTVGIALELIVVDGMSTDNSTEILKKYSSHVTKLIREKDTGPSNAINKGLAMATGDVVSWLNADDIYFPNALERVKRVFQDDETVALCFGRCPIIDKQNREIRTSITRFKEFFFPLSSRFTIQCINYVSQPAMFFSREAFLQTGFLREDMVAAWDYDFLLRLWRQGKAKMVPGGPVSAFRWHDGSISGRNFKIQFKEELEIAMKDAGMFSPQALIHYGVRWGIVGAYMLMSLARMSKRKNRVST